MKRFLFTRGLAGEVRDRLSAAAQAALRTAISSTVLAAVILSANWIFPQSAAAYPFWAQEAYETPREATGRIVCANCHLAEKPTKVEVPQSVMPNTVFEAVVKIPYDHSAQQVTGSGEAGPLNVGAVLMLPEGFKIAPEDRLSEEMKEKTEGIFFQSYAEGKDNVVIVGPVDGDEYSEIVFPVLSPDPKADKSLHFGKYPVHVGGNRGRGQVYPTGDKSNNAIYTASTAGTIAAIAPTEYSTEVTISTDSGDVVDSIPAGPQVIVEVGQAVAAGEAITNDPNVGGFGQVDVEIVLQDPARVAWLLVFFLGVMVTQVLLALKKKQVEKVQLAEMNF
ncbi:MAG: apocytochrome f [Cyanobacteria bacterium P01_C01_bin.89]